MKTKFILTLAAGSLILVAACKSKNSTSSTDSTTTTTTDTVMKKDTIAKAMADIKPSGPAPAWAPDIKPQMQAVIEKLDSYGDRPIPTLSAVDARKNHTPTDAVMDLMSVGQLEICPWALREGVILKRLDMLADPATRGLTPRPDLPA